MLVERLAKLGSGNKRPALAVGANNTFCPAKRATESCAGIVIREPPSVIWSPRLAKQICVHPTEQDSPHPTASLYPATPSTAADIPEALSAMSSAALGASPKVEGVGKTTRDPNDRSYLGWNPQWTAG